jgi:23S rRNA (cytidine1920-2'-O)/16S rRNA (cytidine1409-2'-O)-methyltransferase
MNTLPMTKQRVDLLLVAKGLSPTRAKARAAIEAGLVQANGRIVQKPSEMLDEDCDLTAGAAFAWVSRAGAKLVAGLDAFGIHPDGRICLDIGASTGGFSEVLLDRGAAYVYAVDVGRGQLDPSLAIHPRLSNLEALDARELTSEHLGEQQPDLIVADVSFIGLEKVLPSPLALCASTANLIALIKPQFQAGPARVGKGGIVNPALAEVIAQETIKALDGIQGFQFVAMIDSPITGADGNREFLLHARRLAI